MAHQSGFDEFCEIMSVRHMASRWRAKDLLPRSKRTIATWEANVLIAWTMSSLSSITVDSIEERGSYRSDQRCLDITSGYE